VWSFQRWTFWEFQRECLGCWACPRVSSTFESLTFPLLCFNVISLFVWDFDCSSRSSRSTGAGAQPNFGIASFVTPTPSRRLASRARQQGHSPAICGCSTVRSYCCCDSGCPQAGLAGNATQRTVGSLRAGTYALPCENSLTF
jgi:hypothetical protein